MKIDSTTKYNIGQRVASRVLASQKGCIRRVMVPRGGNQFYDVLWDDNSFEMVVEHQLQEEKTILSAWDLLKNNSLRDHQDFSIASTLHKVRNTTSNTISTLQASRTIFMPYQFKPLVKFLKSDLKRILIADEVGLGKTIEAGHIMLELAARNTLNNVLVICTSSLQDKWKLELQEKFNFILKKYDTKNFIEDINNDFTRSRKSIYGIVNYEKLRNEELQKVLEETDYSFDLVICDEAHKIRNSETKHHRIVSKIVEKAGAVVFLTATPIMTDLSNLHNLIRVLDREGYETYDIFYNAIKLNQPFITAVNKLNANQPLSRIGEELQNTIVVQQMTAERIVYNQIALPVKELFKEDQLYQRAITCMLTDEDNIENRVKVQHDLLELNSLNHLFTRTRKRDVMSGDNIVRRKAFTIPVYLSEEERDVYDSIIEAYDDEHILGLIQKKRQISSSIIAFQSSKEQLEEGLYLNDFPDAKYEALKVILDAVVFKEGKKLIVFAFFTKTLLYLKAKLKETGIEVEMIYGAVKDRTERLERFENNDNIKVLLSSEVGSEGLDLQFCDAIVNYDLPWNPMVVEQRIGRIDRVGQKAEMINIYNLIIHDTIEERIHERLYQRIKLFERSIGDLEEILGENENLKELISKGIENLYRTKLTKKEQNEKLDQMSIALESEKQTLQKVNTELQDAFANDIHFQNEIQRITENNRYLTKEEIIKYVESIIRIYLSALKLEHVDDHVSELHIPANGKTLLFDFIEKYKDSPLISSELENLYRKFKAKYNGARKITITFDQAYANKHKSIEYVTAFHPFINAITNFFSLNAFDRNLAHKVAIEAHFLSEDKRLNTGYYILAIYRFTIRKNYGNNNVKELHLLHPVLADLNGDAVEVFEAGLSEYIHGVVQSKGIQLKQAPAFDEEAITEVSDFIAATIYDYQAQLEEDEKVKFLSSIRRRTEQEVNYLSNRIHRMERMLLEGKGIEAILFKSIEELKNKKELLLKVEATASLNVSHASISVNLIEVI